MSYLTKIEFEELTGLSLRTDPDVNFDALLNRASSELDVVTRFYFVNHPLTNDIRSRQFKRALAYQVEFYITQGATSLEELSSQPDSVTIGDTRIDYSRTQGSASGNKRKSALSKDALNALAGTGLLYRGGGGHGF